MQDLVKNLDKLIVVVKPVLPFNSDIPIKMPLDTNKISPYVSISIELVNGSDVDLYQRLSILFRNNSDNVHSKVKTDDVREIVVQTPKAENESHLLENRVGFLLSLQNVVKKVNKLKQQGYNVGFTNFPDIPYSNDGFFTEKVLRTVSGCKIVVTCDAMSMIYKSLLKLSFFDMYRYSNKDSSAANVAKLGTAATGPTGCPVGATGIVGWTGVTGSTGPKVYTVSVGTTAGTNQSN